MMNRVRGRREDSRRIRPYSLTLPRRGLCLGDRALPKIRISLGNMNRRLTPPACSERSCVNLSSKAGTNRRRITDRCRFRLRSRLDVVSGRSPSTYRPQLIHRQADTGMEAPLTIRPGMKRPWGIAGHRRHMLRAPPVETGWYIEVPTAGASVPASSSAFPGGGLVVGLAPATRRRFRARGAGS